MEDKRICKDCFHKDNCSEIYRQMGRIKGKSVTLKVIVAFLLPLIIFIATLAIFQELTAGMIKSEGLQTILGLLAAFAAGFTCVLISKLLNREAGQNR
jgi:hypothetical protein